MRWAALCLVLVPLAACQKDTDPGPGGVTVGEARALDDAAAMLDARPKPPLDEATVPADLAEPPAAKASAAPGRR